jgi:tRNA G18 (ribose-2'-O)-methylase SpoU
MGALFHLSIHRDVNLKEFKKDYEIIGTSQKESNLDSFKTPKKFILIIGSEAKGISKENLKHINNMLGIKRFGFGDSLNAAIAASIIMYRLSM